MPSPAERVRRVAELVLRATALAALAVLLWRALRPPTAAGVSVAAGDLTRALERWTLAGPAELRVVLDKAPDARTRDWIRALAHSGSQAQWAASRPIRGSAVIAEPASEPSGATRVRFAAAGGEPVSIGDAAGTIDTLSRGGAAELELASVAGSVRASGATFTAATAARDSIALDPQMTGNRLKGLLVKRIVPGGAMQARVWAASCSGGARWSPGSPGCSPAC